MALVAASSVACSSAGPEHTEAPVTCEIIGHCDPHTLSAEARVCPGRISDQSCGDDYRTWLKCEYSDCSAASAPSDAGASACTAQLEAWQACHLAP